LQIDIAKIEVVRNNLLDKLLEWQAQNPEGLWRSTPDKSPGTNPSYTCSAVAIQALTEANRLDDAHNAAKRVDNAFFPDNSIQLLPFEATGTGYHIVNQAWVTFILQETRVRKGKDIWPAIEKLIDQQEKGGFWYLVSGDKDNEINSPIFDAYCIIALAEFIKSQRCDALIKTEKITPDQLETVKRHLGGAVDWLYDSKLSLSGKSDYWWPIKHSANSDPNSPNFEVTLLCLHAITKAGRVLNKDMYVDAADKILTKVLEGIRHNNDQLEFDINGHAVNLYDSFSGGAHNYSFGLYAPICCVTILSYITSELSDKSTGLNEVVGFFIGQIFNNMPRNSYGKNGVYSRPGSVQISIWATAHAIIVLSRVLKHPGLFKTPEGLKMADTTLLATPIVQTGSLGANDYSRFDDCIAIYCPLREEREVFEHDIDFDFIKLSGLNNWYETEYSDFKLLLYQSDHMGRVPAAIDTLTLLNKLGTNKPNLIISTGICGGIVSKKVTQGDVIVPFNVFDLARRKINETPATGKKKNITTEFRAEPINLDARLAKFAKSTLKLTEWRYKCSKLLDIKDRAKDHPNYIPKVHTLDILCSDEVVASENWANETLLKVWPNACAVEMEAGGVCAAAKSYGNIPVAVVKGVSDMADILKFDDTWRQVCMYSTIQFIKDYIEEAHS
jgi:nucleoside phosphorylase